MAPDETQPPTHYQLVSEHGTYLDTVDADRADEVAAFWAAKYGVRVDRVPVDAPKNKW